MMTELHVLASIDSSIGMALLFPFAYSVQYSPQMDQ